MADGGHVGDREQFWRDHVAGWKSSGLSLRLYSEEHGLKAGTLGSWNSRLKARSAEAPAPSSGPEATFLAVRVAEPAVAAVVIGLPDGVRVYLAAGRTDLRRGIDGLAAQIQTVLREDPFSGHLFIFRGRAAHTIKVLMYDGSGFLLMQKRLTEGKFIWPSPADGIVTISRAQMSLLIDGLDWRAAKARSVAKPLFIV